MARKRSHTAILFIVAIVLFVVVIATQPKSDLQTMHSDREAPSLSLQDYSGATINLAEISTPTILNSWASWCPFCVEELPDFVSIQEEFGGEITVVAINREESLAKAKGFTDEMGISDDLVFLLDPDDQFYNMINTINAMPQTLFVNTHGDVVVHKRGFMALEEIRQHTQTLLASEAQQ